MKVDLIFINKPIALANHNIDTSIRDIYKHHYITILSPSLSSSPYAFFHDFVTCLLIQTIIIYLWRVLELAEQVLKNRHDGTTEEGSNS